MAGSQKPLDMLPLLDVMMVILFAFATIQEGKLADTDEERDAKTVALAELIEERDTLADESDQLRKERDVAQEKLDKAEIDKKIREIEQLTEMLQAKLDENKQLKEREKALDMENLRQKNALDALEADLRKLKELPESQSRAEQERKNQILERLLEKNKVLEIEMKGTVGTDGLVTNHCCYRTDPTSQTWESCGAIPPLSENMTRWMQEDRYGLAKALRKTFGGNAITIIRRDNTTTRIVGEALTKLVQQEFPEQKVYNAGVAVVEADCF